MSLFDKFKKKKTVPPMEKSKDAETYYFENHVEFITYVTLCARDRDVVWANGDKFSNQFKKGYELFELGRYSEAIKAYQKCLELNPIGINARFEICEANLKLGNLQEARETLLAMKDFLVQREKIAQFYRRMGYIAIEEQNYKTAAACYLYSKEFADHPSVLRELAYISVKGGFKESIDNIEETLIEANIPILKTVNRPDDVSNLTSSEN